MKLYVNRFYRKMIVKVEVEFWGQHKSWCCSSQKQKVDIEFILLPLHHKPQHLHKCLIFIRETFFVFNIFIYLFSSNSLIRKITRSYFYFRREKSEATKYTGLPRDLHHKRGELQKFHCQDV